MRKRSTHRQISVMVLAAVLATAASASESDPVLTLKVDLQEVTSTGEVAPVNGVTTAGQPDAAALAVFAKQGYKTVIDLRSPRENRGLDEETAVDGLGMKYINLPIAGLDAINFDSARKLDELIANADGPVLVHCGSANRVGALLALSKSLDGESDEAALEYGRAGGMTRLESRVKEVLAEK